LEEVLRKACARRKRRSAIYTLPDVCLTPVGSSVVPVPYAVYAELKQSVRVAKSVKANGHPVVIYDETYVSHPGRLNSIEPGGRLKHCG
jgi:hypothetical protein